MRQLGHDLRHALRQALRAPGVSLTVIGMLAIAIAGNATVFSVVSALLLEPLPFREPERVVSIYTSDYSSGSFGTSSYLDYQDFQERLTSFEQIAASRGFSSAMATGTQATPVALGLVSGNYFATLGVAVERGRALGAADDRPGAPPTVVVSYAFWRSHLNGDPAVAGTVVRIGGQPFTVVGVAASGFDGPVRGEVQHGWAPLVAAAILEAGSVGFGSRDDRSLDLFGRLRPGVSLTEARSEAAGVAAQQFLAYPAEWRTLAGTGREIVMEGEVASRTPAGGQGAALGSLGLLLFVTTLVLLIVCANLANLLLARGIARRHAMAIRISLGASRSRLIRQTLFETGILGLIGGVLGFVGALWGTGAISGRQLLPGIPFQLTLHPDWRVALFTTGVALVAGLSLGIVPALRASQVDPLAALQQRGATAGPRVGRLQAALVVSQVSLSLLLLIGGGLFLRSLDRAATIDPGFTLRRGLLLSFNAGLAGTRDATQYRIYLDALLERARAVPGVDAVVLTSRAPLSPGRTRRWVRIAGYTPQPGEEMEWRYTRVSAGYFETLGIPMVLGRGLSAEDERGEGGIVISQAFAARYWPGQNPLDQRVSVTGEQGPFVPVVGVARDIKYSTLDEADGPSFYISFLQQPAASGTLVIGTRDEPGVVAGRVREAAMALDPAVPVTVTTLDEHMGRTLQGSRLASGFIGGFGALGLLLAALGLAAVLSYAVAQRTREIGIRLALGGRPERVMRMIVGRGLGLTGAGVLLGLALAVPTTRLLRDQLFGLSPLDPVTYVAVTLLFVLVAVAASGVPAWRATRVDPAVVLREE